VLITGVYGLIAGAIYKRFLERSDLEVYGLARRKASSERVAKGEFLDVPADRLTVADLTDFEGVKRATEGMDVVVQMAADPRPNATWQEILNSNMIGAYHVFEASRLAGVKRVVYASSIMANWGYWDVPAYKAIREGRYADVPDPLPIVRHTDPPRPTEPYSASKVWGEALARTYSDVHKLSCLCVRIGWVNAEDRPYKKEIGAVWCSQRDIVQLVERCVDAPEVLRFDIFYGISNNRYCWADIGRAGEVVGYRPQDGE
jgi:nucleoside-diphosphate-sugar epimerase